MWHRQDLTKLDFRILITSPTNSYYSCNKETKHNKQLRNRTPYIVVQAVSISYE